MHWKTKSIIQNLVSSLPTWLSYAMYYWMQRHFGGLRIMNPTSKLIAGVETWKQIQQVGHNPVDKDFLEVGTGRVPIVPLAFWLMGAKSTVSIDLNPYLKEALVIESLKYIVNNKVEIANLFGPLLCSQRFEELVKFTHDSCYSLRTFLELCNIRYYAPGDAANTKIDESSIDFHTSYTVFEHIPEKTLIDIVIEGNRIVRKDGLFVHRIDYSDHFSHSDKSISAINFLQYNETEWSKYAGNRFMYMNRMRHDDFEGLFRSCGHKMLAIHADINDRALELLSSGLFPLNERFIKKSESILATTGAWIVSQKSQ